MHITKNVFEAKGYLYIQVFNSQLTDLLIVLDEPLAGLSCTEKEIVYKNILQLKKNIHCLLLTIMIYL